MASIYDGLFTNPADIRNARIDDLMKQRQAIQGMGGSMAGLLGQVAAGGGATGSMMAEALGGMFGMKTQEEADAAKMSDLFMQLKNPDTTDEQRTDIYKQMSMVSPKAAMAVEQFQAADLAKKDAAEARALKAKQAAARTAAADWIGKQNIPNAGLIVDGVLSGDVSIKDAIEFAKVPESWKMMDNETAKALFGEGAVAQIGPKGETKLIKDGVKLNLEDTRMMQGPDGQPALIGTVGGKTVRSTPEGTVPTDLVGYKPMPSITKTTSFEDSLSKALPIADGMLKDKLTRIQDLSETTAVYDAAKAGNVQALNNLEIRVTALNREGRFSMAQLEQAVRDRALAQSIATKASELFTGQMTQEKALQVGALLETIKNVATTQYNSELDRFVQLGSGIPEGSEGAQAWKAAAERYTLGGAVNAGYDPLVMQYLNKAAGKGK